MVNLIGATALLAVATWIWPASWAGRSKPTSRPRWRATAGLGLVGAMTVLAPPSWWATGLAAGCAAATGLGLARRMRRRRADRDERTALVGALRAVIRELDGGADPSAATRRATEGQPAWLVNLLVTAVCHGESGEHPRWQPVADRVAAAAAACARHGIALTVMIRPIADDLADRAAALTERDTHTAGPAMSGYVLAALPVGGIALGAGMGADPIRVLVGSGLGSVLLLVGVALVCAGLMWADRIVAGDRRD